MVEKFLLKLNNINKQYRTQHSHEKALNNISLSVKNKEILFICGPNGSGKTTLLKVIAGSIGYEGEILCNLGEGVHPWDQHRINNCIWVPQDINEIISDVMLVSELVSLSDFDNIARSAEKHKIDWLFNSDNKSISKKYIGELSGGQKQLLIGLIALSARKPIMLLDEVFRPLDNEVRSFYLKLLFDAIDLTNGCGIIVTHDLFLAKDNATHILALRKGCVSLDCKADEVNYKQLANEIYNA